MTASIIELNNSAWNLFYKSTSFGASLSRYIDLTYIIDFTKRVVAGVVLTPVIITTSCLAIAAKVADACINVIFSVLSQVKRS